MSSVGERIRKLREDHGISQQALADAIGVQQSTISEIERGGNQPSWKTLHKLAQFFDVQPGNLLNEPAPSPLPTSVAAGQ